MDVGSRGGERDGEKTKRGGRGAAWGGPQARTVDPRGDGREGEEGCRRSFGLW
jgi:hypothetical protein